MNVGGHGVELFFMISGFLIPASLVRHGSFWKFIRDRVMRIMPVFGVLHLLLFIVGPIVGYKFFRDIDALQSAETIDTVVATNLHADILSDLAAALEWSATLRSGSTIRRNVP